MKLTVEDIRNPNTKSGFKNVGSANPGSPRPSSYWRAKVRIGPNRNGWNGPVRSTPEEAAQDYCDYLNGNPTAKPKRLKSAGHKEVDPRPRSQRTKRSPRQLAKKGLIYLVSDGEYVKIGWTSRKTISGRLREMQTGNARVLRVLGSKPGTMADEAALHQKYIKQNVLQEWFLPSKELEKEFTE
jgi:hypothetical protein